MVNSMVERATSSQLIGPDWAMNIDICDALNKDPGLAKDVVKGVKKRIGSKNPKVQLLALTLLETIVKNCGDIVHMHVAEKEIPHDMVKITKKKPDFQVKEKILTLIDTWQEAFGGPRARYPQYYAAYQELLRAGAVFPHRSESSAPVFTPPQTQPLSYPPNLPNLSNKHQETAEASSDAEYPSLSLTEIQNARGIMDVLAEMLSAINPANKESLRQEVIVDLVEQCRTYKQRVVHLVNATSDESLLCQGLALNDDLQKVLAKHEALTSGTPVLPQEKFKPESSKSLVDVAVPLFDAGESSKQADGRSNAGGTIPASSANDSSAMPVKADPKIDLLSGDLLGDDFSPATPQDALALVPISATQPSSPVASQQNALALIDMFSTPSNTAGSSNSQPPPSAGQSYPGHPTSQHHQNFQLPQSTPYANGMATGMGLPQYEQSGYPPTGWNPQVGQQQPLPLPQPLSLGYGALNVQAAQQQPQLHSQSTVYGAQNGGTFPPPPWEAQQAAANQPFSPNQAFSPNHPFSQDQPFGPTYSSPMQVPSMGGQQSPTFQGGMHPIAPQPTGNEQVGGMYSQQIAGGLMSGMNSQHMPNHMASIYSVGGPMMGMGMAPQEMQATQMGSMYPTQVYGNQVVGYGYGYSYAQQLGAQYLDRRMYGLSLRDDSGLRSSSSEGSMASYLPPMRLQPKGDDKLFGDLVDMAKLKPGKPNNPSRTGSV